jgi:hypothetical protein
VVKFGIKAGLNYANQTGAAPSKLTDNLLELSPGFIAEIKLTDGFAIHRNYFLHREPYKMQSSKIGYYRFSFLLNYLNKSIRLDPVQLLFCWKKALISKNLKLLNLVQQRVNAKCYKGVGWVQERVVWSLSKLRTYSIQ